MVMGLISGAAMQRWPAPAMLARQRPAYEHSSWWEPEFEWEPPPQMRGNPEQFFGPCWWEEDCACVGADECNIGDEAAPGFVRDANLAAMPAMQHPQFLDQGWWGLEGALASGAPPPIFAQNAPWQSMDPCW